MPGIARVRGSPACDSGVVPLRPARSTDTDRLAAILAATGAELPASLDAYLSVVVDHGQLLVHEDAPGAAVSGFGGVVPLDDGGALVTDLFVHPAAQGRGVGGTILDALLTGRPRRTTFSSGHPAALPAYARRGMAPRWTLHYRNGVVRDVASLDIARDSARGVVVSEVDAPRAVAAELLGRSWLVRWFADQGARCLELRAPTGDDLVGAAIVAGQPDGTHRVERLVTIGDASAATVAVLAWIGVGASVTCCVPAHSSADEVLERVGFQVVDADTCCSTESDPLPSHLVALHPGLG